MTRKEALESLLVKVEAGVRPCREADELDESINHPRLILSSYEGSLDAAKALHEAVLPVFHLDMAVRDGEASVFVLNDEFHPFSSGWNRNPARAWLIAILKALISQEAE